MAGSDRSPDAPPRRGRPLPGSVWLIAALCILPELVLTGADWRLWGAPWWRPLAYQYAGFWPGLLHDWRPNYAAQPWTMFVSYGFLHAGPWHLAVNLATLLLLAGPVAARFGRAGFLRLYGLSLLGGAVGFAALTQSPAPMVGASGALFGLAGALLALDFDRRIAGGRPVRNTLALVAGLTAGGAAIAAAAGSDLAWQAHLGGFVTGWFHATALALRQRA